MNKKVSMSELSPLLMESLQNGGEVVLTVSGRSMAPMLRHHKDKVCLVSPHEGYLQKYELPLFMRGDGRYILHRIVEVTRSGYATMGDNQCVKEYPIQPSQIIGVVKGFWRNGRYVACDNPFYLFYCRLWYFLYPARWGYLKSKHIFKGCIRFIAHSTGG